MKKNETLNFDATIKRLEEEGKRLGSVRRNENMAALNKGNYERRTPAEDSVMSQLDKLRKEIDLQNQQTLNLEREIQDTAKAQNVNASYNRNTNNSNNYSTNLTSMNNLPGPYGEYLGTTPTFLSSFKPPDNVQSSMNTNQHLGKALEDSQTQVEYLTKQLKEVHEMCNKQKEQFRSSVEELQLKLQETVSGRKRLMDMRESEMLQQEDMICRLQGTVKELAASNQMQEQVLQDVHYQMDMLQRKDKTQSSAIDQIRTILLAQDRLRGKSTRFTDSQRAADISPDLLVDSLERFIMEYQEENDDLRKKILQLEAKIRSNDETYKAQTHLIVSEHNQQLNEIKTEANDKLDDHRRNHDERQYQIKSLKDKLESTEHDNESLSKSLKHAKDELKMITKQFEDLKSHYLHEKDALESKVQSLTNDREEMHKQATLAKCECDNLKQRLGEAQSSFLRTNEDLKSIQDRKNELTMRETELTNNLTEARHSLDERSAEVSRLREMNSELRAETMTRINEQIRQTELAERAKADLKVNQLTDELHRTRAELAKLQGTLEATEKQIADVAMEKTKHIATINDKGKELEQLKSQCHLMELKLTEVNDIRQTTDEKLFKLREEHKVVVDKNSSSEVEVKKLKQLLHEKEQSSDHYRHRVDSLTNDTRKYAHENDNLKKLNKDLMADVKKNSSELEAVRDQLSSRETKVVNYESRISDLLQEKCGRDKKWNDAKYDVEKLTKRNKKLEKETKESSKQVSALVEERESLNRKLLNDETSQRKETNKLKKQLKHAQNSLQQAEASLQTIKSVDGRSAKVAQSMQKELTDKRNVIDTLKTELNKAYDRCDSHAKELDALKHENTCLSEQNKQLTMMKQELNEKLRSVTKTEKGYKLAVDRLQKGLENAANRNVDAQAMIQRQEQEIAQSKIGGHAPTTQLQTRTADAQPTATTMPVSLPTFEGATAQAILGKIILDMNKKPDDKPKPHLLMPTRKDAEEAPKEQMTTNASPTDIYMILSEVRDHLINQNDKENDVGARRRKSSKRKKRKDDILPDESVNIDGDVPHLTLDSCSTSVCSLSILREQTTLNPDDLSTITINETSSPMKQSNNRPSSPVSNLLLVSTQNSPMKKSPKRVLGESKENELNLSTSEKDTNTSELLAMNPNNVVMAISNTADDLCKQLQSRLDGLTKLGGRLQKQNKATDNMIRRQDKDLKKVRETASKLR